MLVVVDVYDNETMKQADIKILLKPGTDGAFALGDFVLVKILGVALAAAVVLGGVSLFGGSGSAIGAIFGALMFRTSTRSGCLFACAIVTGLISLTEVPPPSPGATPGGKTWAICSRRSSAALRTQTRRSSASSVPSCLYMPSMPLRFMMNFIVSDKGFSEAVEVMSSMMESNEASFS